MTMGDLLKKEWHVTPPLGALFDSAKTADAPHIIIKNRRPKMSGLRQPDPVDPQFCRNTGTRMQPIGHCEARNLAECASATASPGRAAVSLFLLRRSLRTRTRDVFFRTSMITCRRSAYPPFTGTPMATSIPCAAVVMRPEHRQMFHGTAAVHPDNSPSAGPARRGEAAARNGRASGYYCQMADA